MFVRDLLTSLLRRWYLVAAGLLATAAAVLLLYQTIPVTYEAKASVVLIPPTDVVVSGDNPYLYLGGLDQALGVLQVKVNSPAVRQSLLGQYPGGTYEVVRDAATSGPIMLVTAGGASEQACLALLKGVVGAVPQTLEDMQSELNVPGRSRISVLTLALDTQAVPRTKQRLQAVLLSAVGGGAATLLLTGLLDRALARRNDRRSGAPAHRGGGPAREANPGHDAADPGVREDVVSVGRSRQVGEDTRVTG